MTSPFNAWDVVAAVASAVQAAGVIIAGWWAWWRFGRTREHSTKIHLAVSAHGAYNADGRLYCHLRVELSNVGRTQTTVTAPLLVEVRSAAAARLKECHFDEPDWDGSPLSTGRAFAHAPTGITLEPGEVVSDDVLVVVSKDVMLVRATARVSTVGRPHPVIETHTIAAVTTT